MCYKITDSTQSGFGGFSFASSVSGFAIDINTLRNCTIRLIVSLSIPEKYVTGTWCTKSAQKCTPHMPGVDNPKC